jgi:transposase
MEALGRAEHGDEGARKDVHAELKKLRAAANAKRDEKKARQKAHGKRDVSQENLPVHTIVLEPPERLIDGGDALIKIGEEVAEHLDYRPSSLVRVRVVRPKYKVPAQRNADSTQVLIAKLPERPIAKSIAGPGLLAHILVQKFGDQLPLHRQEVIFRRHGVRMPVSTLATLVQSSTSMLKHIVDAMWQHARDHASWVAVDATGVLVLKKERCRRGHFWVVCAERDHVLFRYTPKHNGQVPIELLKGFSGYVIADASSVYHALYRTDASITEVGCWAHARRKFFDAMIADKERALVAIGFIGLLYDAHRAATDTESSVTSTDERRKLAAPILDNFYAWVKSELPKIDDISPMKGALNYVINHKIPLSRFLEDGILRLDNNISELELRRQAVGRKNWLFCGSDDGAHWNAIATSLIASCALHDIEPWAYLRDVLMLLPCWPKDDMLALCPKLWNQTRQHPETQRHLATLRLLDRDHGHGTNANSAASPRE